MRARAISIGCGREPVLSAPVSEAYPSIRREAIANGCDGDGAKLIGIPEHCFDAGQSRVAAIKNAGRSPHFYGAVDCTALMKTNFRAYLASAAGASGATGATGAAAYGGTP